MQTLKNKLANHQRARRRESALLAHWTEGAEHIAAPGDMAAELAQRQQVAEIRAFVAASFDEVDRQLFQLLLVEDRSHKAAAQLLGITVWNSQKRLERIRKRLREAFPKF